MFPFLQWWQLWVVAERRLIPLPSHRSFKLKTIAIRPINVRALMVLYPNRMHVVTVDGTGITKMSDLKGKRVSTGAPNSATQIMAYRVLEAYGAYGEKQLYGKTVVGVIRSTFVVDVDAKGKATIERAMYAVKAKGHVAKLRRDLNL